VHGYPLLNLFWTMLILFLWILWFFLLFRIILDIFRDHELGGLGKTLWLIFIIVLPFLGVFVYLIARGSKMQARDIKAAQANEAAMRSYVREAAGTSGSAADELSRLADLKERGVLTDAEFAQQKARILGS
jgi:hypothetical protein